MDWAVEAAAPTPVLVCEELDWSVSVRVGWLDPEDPADLAGPRTEPEDAFPASTRPRDDGD